MTTNRTDVRLANEAWEAVLTAHTRLTARFAAQGAFSEVSMREYDVLYTLAKHGEPMRLSEVQRGVLLSQPALSRLVDRLLGRGLLERCSDEADRRAVRISLTEQGAQLQREVGRTHAKGVARELSATLSVQELHTLRQLASKLVAAEPLSSDPAKDSHGPH